MATRRLRSRGWMWSSLVLLVAGLAATPSGARAEEKAPSGDAEKAPPSEDADAPPDEAAPSEDEEPASDSEPDEPAPKDEDANKKGEASKDKGKAAEKEEPPKKEPQKKRAKAKDAPKKAPPEKTAKRAKPKAEEPKDEDEPEKKEIIRQVKPSRYIRIRARSVKLKSKSHSRLLDIAKRYHEDTGKKLLITGGDRTPHRQAQLMYAMLAKGDDLLKLYTQVRLVLELTKIYESGKKKKRGARNIIRDMAKAISEQVKRGEYVSHHLAYTAADVRSRGLKDDHVAALRKAVNAVPGAKLVDERKSDAPHFHLSL